MSERRSEFMVMAGVEKDHNIVQLFRPLTAGLLMLML